MKLTRLKSTSKICATAALVALLAAAGTGTAAALRVDTTSEDTTFEDVGEDHIFSTEISVLVEAGVLTESDATGGEFNSGEPVKMADMAIWMGNLAEKYDVDTKSIDFVADSVEESTSRGSAAGILSRFFDVRRPGVTHTFGDVSDWSAVSVSSLEEAGITYGCGDGTNYCGTRPFTRGQAAAFMGRFVEKYGASRATPIADDSPLWTNAGIALDYAYRDVADTSTYTATCSDGTHVNSGASPSIPSSHCHRDHAAVPACSPTAGVNLNYFVHDGVGGHRSGFVPACPPPTIDRDHSSSKLIVTAGGTPTIVLTAADGAQVTHTYKVALIPYTQTEKMRTLCDNPPLSKAPQPKAPQPRKPPPVPTCTIPAIAGKDYVDVTWLATIGPATLPVRMNLVDPATGDPVPSRTDFGTNPRAIQFVATDVKNPAVSVTGLIILNPPAVPRG